MLALYRCGRQADALDAYQDAARVLRDELGLEPGAQLRDLEHAILNHAPWLDAPAPRRRRVSASPCRARRSWGVAASCAELTALVTREDVRIVTVSGAGGSGKTRVALELARPAGPRSPTARPFVELAAVRDPALVIGTIAQALGASETPQEPPAEALARWLAERELLLVVDNFEHVVAAAPELARLAARAPRLTVLVTSRRVLHVSGEHVFALAPLPRASRWRSSPSARGARPGGGVEPGDEHAAPRDLPARRLPAAGDRAGGGAYRDAHPAPAARPPRRPGHGARPRARATRPPASRPSPTRSRGARTCSSDDERRTLARLSVFAGGCSLDAAEAVCGATLESIEALVDLSLLQRAVSSGLVRLTMLETVREHAAGLLDRTADAPGRVGAHAAYYADLVERTELKGALRARGLALVDAELDNLRAAFDRAQAAGDDHTALRIATALY